MSQKTEYQSLNRTINKFEESLFSSYSHCSVSEKQMSWWWSEPDEGLKANNRVTAFTLNIPDFQASVFKETQNVFGPVRSVMFTRAAKPPRCAKQAADELLQTNWKEPLNYIYIVYLEDPSTKVWTFCMIQHFAVVSFHTHCASGALYVISLGQSLSKGPFKTGATGVKLHPYHG